MAVPQISQANTEPASRVVLRPCQRWYRMCTPGYGGDVSTSLGVPTVPSMPPKIPTSAIEPFTNNRFVVILFLWIPGASCGLLEFAEAARASFEYLARLSRITRQWLGDVVGCPKPTAPALRRTQRANRCWRGNRNSVMEHSAASKKLCTSSGRFLVRSSSHAWFFGLVVAMPDSMKFPQSTSSDASRSLSGVSLCA